MRGWPRREERDARVDRARIEEGEERGDRSEDRGERREGIGERREERGERRDRGDMPREERRRSQRRAGQTGFSASVHQGVRVPKRVVALRAHGVVVKT